ncbi:hypothetical protein F1559_001001 [Cyanidiococcus yangmingshanensis]|uniref:Uncharacterized protein n=1 Tax=Cyanidiococcus yangmingshanensis TaxID=2690220 RepID=A0A7J7IIJ9_9RHOD|nr:hypothetical protein F1559_001001 [Cyanidiococcus yangmingshanensis]
MYYCGHWGACAWPSMKNGNATSIPLPSCIVLATDSVDVGSRHAPGSVAVEAPAPKPDAWWVDPVSRPRLVLEKMRDSSNCILANDYREILPQCAADIAFLPRRQQANSSIIDVCEKKTSMERYKRAC